MNAQKELKKFKAKLHNSMDLADRTLQVGGVNISFLYIKSLTDNLIFSEAIYQPISNFNGTVSLQVIQQIIKSNDVSVIDESEVLEKILKGGVILFIDGENKYLAVDIMKFSTRAPSEPPTSAVIMGPREGFTEDIQTNISLIRRRFHSKQLVFENVKIGSCTQTEIAVAYLDGIADKKIVKQVKKKLESIELDGVVDSFYLIAFLSSRPNSFIKQVGTAEKPDVVAAKMLEGRVAIIVDNSPIVLTVPFVFLEDWQSSNDYYTNYIYATLIRFIRIIGLVLATLGPGVYIALQLFHYNLLPIKYLITIANSTQQIPFTPFIEILFITLLFQILYEVSLRLPSYLGLATSVVGALILGDTGVKAGLISPPTVIVVAIAKIALYTVPEQAAQITIIQYVFIILGACLGLLGLLGGMIYFIAYANTIENFGAPYLAPFAPYILSDNKDALLKVPISEMKLRPESYKTDKKERMDESE